MQLVINTEEVDRTLMFLIFVENLLEDMMITRGVDSGRGFATSQQHQFQTHTHDIPIHAVGNQDWTGGVNDRPAADDASFIRNVEGGAPNATNGGFNGAETRPRNINFLPIIKT